MNEENCVFCGQAAKISLDPTTGSDWELFDCKNCGKFKIKDLDRIHFSKSSKDEEGALKDEERSLISHIVARHSFDKVQRLELTKAKINDFLKTEKLPSVAQKLENLIHLVGEKTKYVGHEVQSEMKQWVAQIGALNETEVGELWTFGFTEEMFSNAPGEGQNGNVKFFYDSSLKLTYKGWKTFEKIKSGEGDSQLAFMAMPFNCSELDLVFKNYWQEAARCTGYRLERVDTRPEAGSIDDLIRTRIRQASFLICELTYGNHGVYWEAGFAEGVGKPVIYTYKKSDAHRPHFDVNHNLYIEWDESSLEKAAVLLTAVIQETMARRGK